jgi:phosphoacetylglucosamine mutase
MGILTTPQLHWMVRSKNKGIKVSESDYFTQLIDSFRLFSSYCPAALALTSYDYYLW